MTSQILTQDYLNSILRYDPDTGYLYWRVTRGSRAKAGARAGSDHSAGYLETCINGARKLVHHVIWFMHNGVWPKEIDHIDHDRKNNVLSNLREVTKSPSF